MAFLRRQDSRDRFQEGVKSMDHTYIGRIVVLGGLGWQRWDGRCEDTGRQSTGSGW